MARPAYKSARKDGTGNKKDAAGRQRQKAGTRAPKPGADAKREIQSQPTEVPARKHWSGKRLPETTGLVLRTQPDRDYTLVDCGNGRKLERYGDLLIDRPEGQAIWQRVLTDSDWQKADAIFTGDTDEEGAGRWRFPKRKLDETWRLEFDELPYLGRFTSFRHVGVFPEQAAHWHALQNAIRNGRSDLRVLNLFGYTGLASLVAARAGARVTHVDASKKAIGWAKENQALAGLSDTSIRWICEDAVRFCQREVRRGNTYDIILLDPPAYGRGPKGEVWQLFDHLPHMLDLVRQLQSDTPVMTVLTSYAIRASSFALHEIMQEVFAGLDGKIESGELVLECENGERSLSTSMFSRFLSPECQL